MVIESNVEVVYVALTDGKMHTLPELIIMTGGLARSSITQALTKLQRQGIGMMKDPKWMSIQIPYKYYKDSKPSLANRHLSGWKLTEEEIKKWKEGKRTF